jgi:hypothetical protein
MKPPGDAPWCSITSTAASHAYLSDFTNGIEKTKKFSADPRQGVKGRNEPGDVSPSSLQSVREIIRLMSYMFSANGIDHTGCSCCCESKGGREGGTDGGRLEEYDELVLP